MPRPRAAQIIPMISSVLASSQLAHRRGLGRTVTYGIRIPFCFALALAFALALGVCFAHLLWSDIRVDVVGRPRFNYVSFCSKKKRNGNETQDRVDNPRRRKGFRVLSRRSHEMSHIGTRGYVTYVTPIGWQRTWTHDTSWYPRPENSFSFRCLTSFLRYNVSIY